MDISAVIHSVTRLAAPALTPELPLRLVTKESPWWTMTPEDLERQGIPEPFWAFAWGGGQALARYILDHPEIVRDKDVLDFGAGGGIVSLAARKAGARSIRASEIDPWALVAYRLNVVDGDIREEDWIGRSLEAGTVLLCGDMSYSRELCAALMDWFRELKGVEIVLGDAGRGFLDKSAFEELTKYSVAADYDADGRYQVSAFVLRYLAAGEGFTAPR